MDYLPKQKPRIEQKNWDLLLILDACRFDAFCQQVRETKLVGELERVDSEVYNTPEWYNHIKSIDFSDVTLYSAQPWAWHPRTDNCFREFADSELYGISEMIVSTTDDFLSGLKGRMFNTDKVIAHNIQPHLPFTTDEGVEFLDEIKEVSGEPDVYNAVMEYGNKNDDWKRIKTLYWKEVKNTLEEVESFIERDDRFDSIVLTSDHSEVVGESHPDLYNGKRVYNHNHHEFDLLREVPWFEIEEIK